MAACKNGFLAFPKTTMTFDRSGSVSTDLIEQLPDVDPTALRRALANHTSRMATCWP